MTRLWRALSLAVAPALWLTVAVHAQGAPTDCQQDFNCLVQASLTCQPAQVNRTTSVAGGGMVLTATTTFEIRGLEAGRCVLYQRTERASMRFDDEMFERFLSAGLTREQARQEEAQYNQRYAQMATGLDGTCRLATDDLMVLLTRVYNGEYVSYESLRDFCEGPLFNLPSGARAPAGGASTAA